MLVPDLRKIGSHERGLPGEHFDDDAAKGVEVGLSGDRFFCAYLLGRHVGVCADRGPFIRDIGVVHIAGDSKIAKDNVSVGFEEEITWFQVSVNDAMVVGMLQSRRNLSRYQGPFWPGEGALVLESVLESTMGQQLHCVEEVAIHHSATIMADNVGVIESFHDDDLTLESIDDGLIMRNGRME